MNGARQRYVESQAKVQEKQALEYLDNAETAGESDWEVLETVYLHRMWICLFEAALIRDEG